MQTFGIILVVLGHSTYQLGHAGQTPVVCEWLYTFHMPLFFFISGYLLRYTNEQNGRQLADMPVFGKNGFITKKVKRLLVPYVIISSVAFIPKTMMSAIAMRPVELSVWSYVGMLLYPQTNVIAFFWFLPTIFIIFCFALLAAKTRIKTNDLLLIVVLATINLNTPDIGLMGLDTAIYNTIFFAAGYIFRKQRLDNIVEHHATTITVTTFAISITLMFLPYSGVRFIISGLNGTLMSMALAHLYTAHGLHFLDHLEGASYTIYLLSWFPQVASQQVLIALVPGITWHVTTALAFFSGLYVPLLVYRWVKAHSDRPSCRWMTVVLGM